MTSKVCQFLSESGGNNFTESAPRPPVPGEENELTSNGGMSTRSSGSMKSHVSNKSHTSNKSVGSNRDVTTHSPAATPRRSAKDRSMNMMSHSLCGNDDEDAAPLGFEPEGSDSNSPPFNENTTPPYMKWAENLNNLLNDSDGVQLFKAFLEQEGLGTYSVDFHFVCEGLKQKEEGDTKIYNLIRVINKKYLKSDKLPCVSEETKRVIYDKIKRLNVDRTVFDSAHIEVENDMRNNTYPLFIKSDLYVQYVQKGGESPNGSNSSSGSNSARPSSMPLPTLPEDQELADLSVSSSMYGPPPSNKSRSDSAKSYSNTSFPCPLPPRNPPHPYHVSYATTSAQDSELQSLSSDALTEDAMSLTDTSSVDNDPKKFKRFRKAMRKHAEHNRETGVNFIPRTDRAPKDRNIAEIDAKRFAALLIEKLEKVLQDRERDKKIEESLNRVYEETDLEESEKSVIYSRNNTSSTSIIPLMTSTVMDEDNPDSILEEHCSRIWESSAGQTPSRSPGRHSPTNLKPRSPDRSFSRKSLSQTQPLPMPSTLPSHNKISHHKKRPDYYSSFDSGMGEDKPAVETHKHIHHHHHHHHSKSKTSMEFEAQKHYYVDSNARYSEFGVSGDRGRTPRRSMNRKHSDASSNIDSGISMIDSIPPMPNLQDPSTEKVLNWMMDNARDNPNSGCVDSEKSSSHKQRSRSTAPPSASAATHKQGNKKQLGIGSSRSGSVDRGMMQQWAMPQMTGGVVPSQPFATDPSMPLPTPPNTTVQLEEAKRRLEERSGPVKSKSFGGITTKENKKASSISQGNMRPTMPTTRTVPCDLDMSGESGSTLEKKSSTKRSTPSSANTSASGPDETIIGYFFCQEPIPYRISVPGRHITLAQFKQLIGRRGSFKYFFKKKSNEFESEVVFEEIQDDNEELPMWEGKIVAKVERVD